MVEDFNQKFHLEVSTSDDMNGSTAVSKISSSSYGPLSGLNLGVPFISRRKRILVVQAFGVLMFTILYFFLPAPSLLTSNLTTKPNVVTTQSSSNQNRSILFMHVGKAGGCTINSVLKASCKNKANPLKRRKCYHTFNITSESALSKQTIGAAHYQIRVDAMVPKATDFLFSVREPIARFESWFRAIKDKQIRRKRKNRSKHINCFQTAQDMVDALIISNAYKSSMLVNATECQIILQKAFEQVGQTQFGHLTAGYRYYHLQAHLAEHNKSIWVIRTDHMWTDIRRIDVALGGTGNFSLLEGSRVSHGSESFQDKSGVSQDTLFHLCCALRPDVRAYRDILERAVNLNVTEKLNMYELSWRRCNVTSWEMLDDECMKKN